MKKTMKTVISAVLVLVCLLSFAACRKTTGEADLWEKATYQKDTTFGDGAKTVVVEVKVGEKTVTFTVKRPIRIRWARHYLNISSSMATKVNLVCI